MTLSIIHDYLDGLLTYEEVIEDLQYSLKDAIALNQALEMVSTIRDLKEDAQYA